MYILYVARLSFILTVAHKAVPTAPEDLNYGLFMAALEGVGVGVSSRVVGR